MQEVVDYGGGKNHFYPGGQLCRNPKDSSLCLPFDQHVDVYFPRNKRSRISAPFVFDGAMFEKKQSTIDVLPDECLFEVFRRLPGSQERSSCACVSKRWLVLLSHIRRDEIHPSKASQLLEPREKAVPVEKSLASNTHQKDEPLFSDNTETEFVELSDGYLSRCLEGKKATDVRIAAIAVGTAGRGGLGKLSVRGSNSNHKVTDLGLKAIARCCPCLRVLSLWNLSSIGDEGLLEIANECHMLEKIDLCHCPALSDKALMAVAKHCASLTSLAIDSCANVGNDGLQAIGRFCKKLKSVSMKNCPLVSDKGVSSLISSASDSLMKVKLQSLNISDVSLAVIGHYAKVVTDLSLVNLQHVSEKGFWVMGNSQGLQKLSSLVISSCSGVTDLGLEALGKGCQNLKQFCLGKCAFLSDNGFVSFVRASNSIESLSLDACPRFTHAGIFSVLVNGAGKLKALSLANCFGIKDSDLGFPCFSCKSLCSLSVQNCPGIGNSILSLLGRMCPQLQYVDLCGLHGITDKGLLPIIQASKECLKKVKLSDCTNLTDVVVSVIVKLHGGALEVLNLNGCKYITDTSLVAVAKNCVFLSDLDVSRCSITDVGVAALANATQLNLRILSLSGCSFVTNKSLAFFKKIGETLVGLNIQQCNGISSSMVNLLVGQLWKCDILF